MSMFSFLTFLIALNSLKLKVSVVSSGHRRGLRLVSLPARQGSVCFDASFFLLAEILHIDSGGGLLFGVLCRAYEQAVSKNEL